CRPRSASNSSTSRYDKEKRRYQPTARRLTSGSNCLHLNRPETDDARSIGPVYQTTPAKLQHCPFVQLLSQPEIPTAKARWLVSDPRPYLPLLPPALRARL